MAKRRKKKRYKSRSQRDVRNISKRRNLLRDPLLFEKLHEIEDRRRYHPYGYITARMVTGREAPIRATTRNLKRTKRVPLHRSQLGFEFPRDTLVCRRRAKRRETLFRRKLIGSGKSSKRFKPRRMTETSKVRC